MKLPRPANVAVRTSARVPVAVKLPTPANAAVALKFGTGQVMLQANAPTAKISESPGVIVAAVAREPHIRLVPPVAPAVFLIIAPEID